MIKIKTKKHLYEIRFKDDNKIFKFVLTNYSNSFYDGWIDFDLEIN